MSLPHLISRLKEREDAVAALEAALEGGLAFVPLIKAPASEDSHALQIFLPGAVRAIVVVADPAGEPSGGIYPMVLRAEGDARAAVASALAGLRGVPAQPSAPAPAFVPDAEEVDLGSAGGGVVADDRRRAEFEIPLSQQAMNRSDALEIDFSLVESRSLEATGLDDIKNQPPWVVLELTANALVSDPASVLLPLDQITDLPRFVSEARRLEKPIAELAHRGEAVALWTALAFFRERAGTAMPGGRTREEVSAHVFMQIMGSAEILAPLANVALSQGGTDVAGETARRLVVSAGGVGARALWMARRSRRGVGAPERAPTSARQPQLAARPGGPSPILDPREVAALAELSPDERARFTALLREIGPPAVPVVAEALQSVGASDSLLEDLLAGVAPTPLSEASLPAAEAARRLSQHASVGVRRASVGALVSLLGAGAEGALVQVLKAETDDGVKVAAITALRQIGRVDREAMFPIDGILTGAGPASADVRRAAAAALADVVPAARPQAAGVLARALRPPQQGLLKQLVRAEDENTALLVTMARVLLSLGVADAEKVVEARAAKAGPEAKQQLRELLTARR